MDRAVFEVCLTEMDIRREPARVASYGLITSGQGPGWSASDDPPFDWFHWWRWLDGWGDISFDHLGKVIQRTRLDGLDRPLALLLADYARWKERYLMIAGALQRADQLAVWPSWDTELRARAIEYRTEMMWLWHECWVWLGWFGRWIHHKTREGAG